MEKEMVFDSLTNEELERSLTQLQAKAEALLRERERRKRVEKENDWEKVVDAINNFANKYGNFYVSHADEDYSIKCYPFDFTDIGTLRIQVY